MESIKVIQVATGMISIPPNGWGAVERVIWAYKEGFRRLGHEIDIRFINNLEDSQGKIVHTHIANLALECKNRNIPYVFSLHDHHSEWYGKDSFVFKQNLEAMKGSIISFTHAEYLIDYFEETDKLFYLPHGCDVEFFTPAQTPPQQHRLLMLANNGLAGNSGFDRKGFRYGIEAARRLKLPITIVGTDNNKEFFKHHQDLLAYDKLNLILENPADEQTRKIYQDHTIFLHPSMLEAGHPNLTLLEAASSCLPIVGTYRGTQTIEGLYRLPDLSTEAVVDGIIFQISKYAETRDYMLAVRGKYDWIHVCKMLERYYKNVNKINDIYDSEKTKTLYTKVYNETGRYAQI